jgi:Mrp family chromosome partitioning ATPase
MARFLDAMKHAEDGHRQSETSPNLEIADPESPPFTLHVAPLPAIDYPDDEPAMPFIEVGPSRSVEGSPDVLAHRPRVALHAAHAPSGPRAVTFRPLAVSVETRTGIAPEVVAFHDPDHSISAQYRELLDAVSSAATSRAAAALFFTGSAAGAGTTTVVLNLAVTAARQGRRVIVVDVHARRPAVAARLALCDRPGLSEVLAGTAALHEAIQETEQAGLFALTSGGPSVTAPRAVEAHRSLLRQLRQRFDLVLIDGPRWDSRPEVIGPGSACDAAFLVVPADANDPSIADELLRQIPSQGVPLAGCVVAARVN